MKDLRNKFVVITGGGSGIGQLMSIKLSQEGAIVIIIDIRQELMDKTSQLIKEKNLSPPHTYVCDLSKREMIYNVAEKIKTEVGNVDIVINNAGIVQGKTFLEISDEQIQKTMDVNTMAHMWLAKAFLPNMIKRNQGHWVTIASAASLTGVCGLADYCASKAAAFGFHESIRLELKKQHINGVKTTVVCPYYINTGMFDGIKSSKYFWWLLPILNPIYVTNQIINAIKTDKELLCMPRIIYYVRALQSFLPISVCDWFAWFLGISSTMDTFKGRGVDWANATLGETKKLV